MKRLNVRWRLTLWYGAILSLIVIGFATCLYWMMDRHLLARTDFELEEELNELALEVRLAGSESDLQHSLQARFFRHSVFNFQVTPLAGDPLFRSERLKAAVLPSPGRDALNQQAPKVVSETQIVDGLGENRIASRIAQGSSGPFVVQASMPLLPNRQELQALLTMLFTAGPLAIAGALGGGYFLARHSLAPVERMATTAQRITANRLNERIEIANPDDELGHLALTLNAMIERLQSSIEEMRRFTADAAHELRTPLAILQTETEVALRSPRSADEYRRVVEVTLDASRRLTRLADQLLVLCRHDSGLQPVKFEEVPLIALLADVVDRLQLAAKENGVAVELGPLGDWIVDGDDIQLSQLLFNLLDNAIKFTPRGGRVRITGKREDGCVELVMADSGAGIAADELPHVFERFYRADKSRNGKTGGTGLGLAICKAIVDAHHGTIHMESSAGHGTSVHLQLPVERAVPSAVRA